MGNDPVVIKVRASAFFGFLFMSVLLGIYRAFVLTQIWLWFATPHGATPLTIFQAIVIMLVTSLLSYSKSLSNTQYKVEEKTETKPNEKFNDFVSILYSNLNSSLVLITFVYITCFAIYKLAP